METCPHPVGSRPPAPSAPQGAGARRPKSAKPSRPFRQSFRFRRPDRPHPDDALLRAHALPPPEKTLRALRGRKNRHRAHVLDARQGSRTAKEKGGLQRFDFLEQTAKRNGPDFRGHGKCVRPGVDYAKFVELQVFDGMAFSFSLPDASNTNPWLGPVPAPQDFRRRLHAKAPCLDDWDLLSERGLDSACGIYTIATHDRCPGRPQRLPRPPRGGGIPALRSRRHGLQDGRQDVRHSRIRRRDDGVGRHPERARITEARSAISKQSR